MRLAAEPSPDPVLMDTKMPGGCGIEATRRILAAEPSVRVLVVTMFEDDATAFTAVRVGARATSLRTTTCSPPYERRGGAVFGPSVAARLTDFLTTPAVPKEAFPALTVREREMLHLIACRASNAEIAASPT